MAFDIRRAKRADTRAFTFHRLSSDPGNPIRLHTQHLGSTNKAYVDAAFTRKPRALEEGKSFDWLAAERDQDLQDLAAFCVSSWENVNERSAPDESGNSVLSPVPCTPEKVLAFLRFALENGYQDEIDAFRTWAKILANFREEIASSEDLGKG